MTWTSCRNLGWLPRHLHLTTARGTGSTGATGLQLLILLAEEGIAISFPRSHIALRRLLARSLPSLAALSVAAVRMLVQLACGGATGERLLAGPALGIFAEQPSNRRRPVASQVLFGRVDWAALMATLRCSLPAQNGRTRVRTVHCSLLSAVNELYRPRRVPTRTIALASVRASPCMHPRQRMRPGRAAKPAPAVLRMHVSSPHELYSAKMGSQPR